MRCEEWRGVQILHEVREKVPAHVCEEEGVHTLHRCRTCGVLWVEESGSAQAREMLAGVKAGVWG